MVNHVLCKAQSSKQMQLYITRGISLKIILGQNSNCDLKIKVTTKMKSFIPQITHPCQVFFLIEI